MSLGEERNPTIATGVGQAAEQGQAFSGGCGRPDAREFGDANLRQILYCGGRRFAELLLEEVACTVGITDRGGLEQELSDLNLLAHCKPALDRRAESG